MRFIIASVLVFFSTALPAAEKTLNTIVAVVNDDVILSSDLSERIYIFTQQWRARGRGQNLPSKNVLRKQILERLIVDRLQLQLAERQGIRVPDERLNASLERLAKEGNKMSLKQFKEVLEKEGFDFAHFREQHRDQITMELLRQRRIGNRITITQQEVDNFLATQAVQGNIQDEFRLAHILVAIPEAASPAQINATREKSQAILARLRNGEPFNQVALATSDGQNALEGGDLGWRKGGELPTPFVPVVTAMEKGNVSDLIRTPSGFHIIQLVDKRGGPKHLITQFHVRHILLQTSAVMSEREVVTRLKELKDRVENGADFTALAKSHSQDKTSAANGGDLGWVSPGEMVPAFEDVMKRSSIDAVSEPFQSRFGWHILQVTGKRNRDNTDEFKRSKARELIRERKFNEEMQSWLRQLRDEAYVDIRLDQYIDNS